MPKNSQSPKPSATTAADLFDDFEDEDAATTYNGGNDQNLSAATDPYQETLTQTQAVDEDDQEMIAQLVRDGLIPPQPLSHAQPADFQAQAATVHPSLLAVATASSGVVSPSPRSKSKPKPTSTTSDPELPTDTQPAPTLTPPVTSVAQLQPYLAQLQTSAPAQTPQASRVMAVTLDQVVFSNLNPRSNAGSDLDEIKQSFGTGAQPLLAQLPTGELLPDGRVRVLSGERRVRAIQESGKWSVLEMVVRPANALTRSQAHTFRVVENLHRQPLNQFDEAAALKISYLLANAQALGAEAEADRLLTQAEENGSRPPVVLRELEQLMEALPNWTPTRPPVTWDTVLDSLGIELEPSRRRQKLRVLEVKAELHPALSGLAEPLSEVALRELGRLGEADQAQLVEAVVRDPARLSDKVVAIVKAIKEKGWSVEQALTHFLTASAASLTATPSSSSSRGWSAEDEGAAGPNQSGSGGKRYPGSGAGTGEGLGGRNGRGKGGGYAGFDGGDFDERGGEGDLDEAAGFSLIGLNTGELSPHIATQLEAAGISESVQLAIATLSHIDQSHLVQLLQHYPKLAGKIRRVIKLMREEGYSLEASLTDILGPDWRQQYGVGVVQPGTSQSKGRGAVGEETSGLHHSWDDQETQANEDEASEVGFEPEGAGIGADYFEFETAYDLESLELSPAIKRALASLEIEPREELLSVLVQHPHIKNKVRRMVSLLKAGATLEEVTDEALGYVGGQPIDGLLEYNELLDSDTPEPRTQEEKLADGTKRILDAISELTDGLDILKALSPSGKLAGLPDPWNTYSVETLGMAIQAMREAGLEVTTTTTTIF